MSHETHFTLFSKASGPSGWKVAILLEELGLTRKTKFFDLADDEHKLLEYTKYKPDGEVPTLVDHHNDDFVVWDSSAIMLYLVERYDKDGTFAVQSEKDKINLQQWLFFHNTQEIMSVQLFYFAWVHPEKLPVPIKRYQSELLRVYSVLEGVLRKLKEEEEKEWLVAGKPTIADFSFIVWNQGVSFLMSRYEGEFNFKKDYPNVAAWQARMTSRPAVKKVLADKTAANRQ